MEHQFLVIQHALEQIGTPRALSLALMIKHKEFDALATATCASIDYDDPWKYLLDAQAHALVAKVDYLPTTFDRRKRAEDEFFASERACFLTNRRLLPYYYGDGDPVIQRFIRIAQGFVKMVLGRVPNQVPFRPGPGCTLSNKKGQESLPFKIANQASITNRGIRFLPLFSNTGFGRYSALSRVPIQESRGNRFSTVPKNSKKDRGIAIEPSLNAMAQLGIGDYMMTRLGLFGLELKNLSNPRSSGLGIARSGKDLHMLYARAASVSEEFATIDLSSASDSIADTLIRILLPEEWYSVLDDCRSHFTEVNGKNVMLEKFSSMGNGFTFPLETLTFAAIAFATYKVSGLTPRCGSNLLVYGDDIIVKNQIAPLLIRTLQFFGFKLNEEKTYVQGPFRESCGGDYWNGTNVRPVYLPPSLPKQPGDYISLHNRLVDIECHTGLDLSKPRHLLLDRLPSRFRVFGPKRLGDLVLNTDESRDWTRKFCKTTQSFLQLIVKPQEEVITLDRFCDSTLMGYALGGGTSDGVSVRGTLMGYTLTWT